MPSELDAILYKKGRTASVIAEGFGVHTRNDAGLVLRDGIVHAEKFGVYMNGPARKDGIERDLERFGDEIFDQIQECTLKTFGSLNQILAIPTTIRDPRQGLIADDWVVFDNDENHVLECTDNNRQNDGEVILSRSKNSVRLIDLETLDSEIGNRYIPAIRVKKTR